MSWGVQSFRVDIRTLFLLFIAVNVSKRNILDAGSTPAASTKKEKEMFLDILKNQMWWILQITGSIGVYFALVPGKKYGLCWKSYLTYVFFATTVCGWMFLKSYETAPSFFQPWFLGTALLALIGFLASMFYFGETINTINYVGAVLGLTGCVLLIL